MEEALLGVAIGAVVGGLLANKFRKRPKKLSAAEKVGFSPLDGDVKTCPNCGETIPGKAKFCTACGAGQPEQAK